MKQKIGIAYPITKSNIGFFNQTFNTFDNTKSNILILLNTIMGERYLNTNFGLNLYKYLFEQLTDDLKQEIIDEIKTKIEIYIPNIVINILNVDFIDINANNNISRNIIKIFLEFSLNNKTDSINIEI